MFADLLRSWLRRLLPENFVQGPDRDLPKDFLTSNSVVSPVQVPLSNGERPFVETHAHQHARWNHSLQMILNPRREGTVIPHPFSLAKLRICSLPPNLTIKGSLDLRQCQRLRRIGAGLNVDGDLQIGGRCDESLWYEKLPLPVPLSRDPQPPLDHLPSNLRVRGDLILRSCHRLQSLPPDVRLEQGVQIEGCRGFKRLPRQLSINGNLTLKGCPNLRELPDVLRVTGDVRLIGLPIDRLPAQLEVGGSLTLECLSQLKQLPAELTVGKSLTIRCCQFETTGTAVTVGRNLVFKYCRSMQSLPEAWNVAGNVSCYQCPDLDSVPANLSLNHSLKLVNCPKLTSLPDKMNVPDVLDLRGCSNLSSLPAGVRVGFFRKRPDWEAALIIVDCAKLRELPQDLRVQGSIDLAGSGVSDVPIGINGSRLLWRGVAVNATVVLRPETLSPEQILNEPNAEIRRIMLDRVGCDTVLAKAKAKTIHEDTDRGGTRRLVEVNLPFQRSPTQRYLQCRCPSTGRVYLLRVPTTVSTGHAAAAWLAGFENPDDYRPQQET